MCLLPFIIPYHYIPISSFYNEWIAACCGLFACMALLRPGLWQTLSIPGSSLIFLGLIIISNLQALTFAQGSLPNIAMIQSYLVWAALLTMLGHYLRTTLGLTVISQHIAWSLLLAASLNLVFVIFQVLKQTGVNIAMPELESYGMLAQTNNFADFISLGMIALLYLHAMAKIPRVVLRIGLLCSLVLLTLSGSRSSGLYLIALVFFSWLLHQQTASESAQKSTTKHLLHTTIALIPVFIIIQLLIARFAPQLLTHTPIMRAFEIMNDQPHSLRWQFWQTSIYLFQHAPILGIGAGQMRWETYLLADNSAANPAHLFFEHAHNLFFHLLAEMGLFAGLITAIGLLLWIKSHIKHKPLTLEKWWLLTTLSVIGIHSMLEYPLWYSFFLGIFAFLLGAGDGQKVSLNALSEGIKKLFAVTVLIVFVYGLQQLILMQIAYQKLDKQINIASQPHLTTRQKQQFIEDMLWVNEHTLLAPCAQLVIASFLSPDSNVAADQLKVVEQAVKFMPLRRANLNLIILLEMHHAHAEALQHLKRRLRISGKQLRVDIQQLAPMHRQLLESLLAEIQPKVHADQ